MDYKEVRSPDGKLLFTFDTTRDIIRIKIKGTVHTVDLAAIKAAKPKPKE